MNKKCIGSDFDDFLAEEGLLPQVESVAVKRAGLYSKLKNLDNLEA